MKNDFDLFYIHCSIREDTKDNHQQMLQNGFLNTNPRISIFCPTQHREHKHELSTINYWPVNKTRNYIRDKLKETSGNKRLFLVSETAYEKLDIPNNDIREISDSFSPEEIERVILRWMVENGIHEGKKNT